MRKTTEELWKEAGGNSLTDYGVECAETFRRLCIENEREAEPVAVLHDDGNWTFAGGASDALRHNASFAGWRLEVFTTPQSANCPRCADYVRYCPECGTVGEVAQTFRDCCPDGSHAGYVPKHIADKLAALEAENARISAELEEAILIHQTDTGTESAVAALQDTIAQQAEQLAAAEKAMNRCYKMLLSEPDTKGALFKAENILREALADAAIAAQS